MSITDPHPEHPIALPMPKVLNAMLSLVDCVCGLLATEGAGPTCWCGMLPGAQASWDYCGGECKGGACGMGWVRLAQVFPYDVFPTGVIDSKCAKPLAWAVEVGAMRCMPVPSDGELPNPDAMAEVAIGQFLDATALYKALVCCDISLGVAAYTPQGPAGGCVGGTWLAFIDGV